MFVKIFLGVLSIMDQGIELSLGFHAANNLITALLVTSTWTVFQTESILIDVSEQSLFSHSSFKYRPMTEDTKYLK